MVKLTDVPGIGPATVKLLSEHNIKTVEALASMSLAELQKIPGMSGDIRARAVKKAAADCLRSMVDKQPSTPANKAQTTVKKVAIKKTAVEQPAANQPINQTEMDEVKDKVKDKDKDKSKNKKDGKKEEKKDKKKKNKNKKKDKKKDKKKS
ncbi:MAG: helix-hairpin-helix domain-containing protein [Nitrosomonas sp.]|uniref:helix-hairpin-helix domain-containing protein n=1 Tax=Nitrosomonas sp. TaxID=42353 RepID=UPI002732D685|nr:helix-hairpin-helix domain-containing protein [Nitrosomonas sp.]MDP3664698.1 helix-hairpin-helix domain-containing protein [Nitrosomonas sp.]MDZ4105159.1 helix-hairpin-helix domain-containing protein [Nitrosomonas sp.]